jgi:hypothetical protein
MNPLVGKEYLATSAFWEIVTEVTVAMTLGLSEAIVSRASRESCTSQPGEVVVTRAFFL